MASHAVSVPQAGEFVTIRCLDIINLDDIKISNRELALVESIANEGVREPILVRQISPPKGETSMRYQLLDGRVRWQAALCRHIFRERHMDEDGLPAARILAKVTEMSEEKSRSFLAGRRRWRVVENAFGIKHEEHEEFPDYWLCEVGEKILDRQKVASCSFFLGRSGRRHKYLDEVARGRKSKRHMERAKIGSYELAELSRDINWWIGVLDSIHLDTEDSSTTELFDGMHGLLYAYADARRDSGVNGSTIALEVLRSYRLFTRSICSAARSRWPNMNMEALHNTL